MPELPELTVFAANLQKRLAGKTVARTEYHRATRLNVTPDVLHDALAGQTLDKVERDGKEMALHFSGGKVVLVHLMLKGVFHILPDPSQAKHHVLTVHFDHGEALIAGDQMGWMTVNLNPTPSIVPDALDITEDYIKGQIARQPYIPAKGFLIDQDVMRGIGNAYADEILYAAKISPKTLMGRIPAEVVSVLVDTTKSVLRDGIQEILARYPDALGGEFRDFLKVHNPKVKITETGFAIQSEEVAGKKSYFTDEQTHYT